VRKKDILCNMTGDHNLFFSYSIKKLTGRIDEYSALVNFLPDCKEKSFDIFGSAAACFGMPAVQYNKRVQWAGPGYRMLMYLPLYEKWCLSAYYAPDGAPLFWYFDISRKNFLDENGMPCTDDIFLDLVITLEGEAVTLDEDELADAFEAGIVSQADVDDAYAVRDRIIKSGWNDIGLLIKFCAELINGFDEPNANGCSWNFSPLRPGHELDGVPGCENFAKIEPLIKGWSDNKKYRIETADGTKLLLRISDANEYARKKGEYGMLEHAASIGLPLSAPVSFGFCNGGKNVYQLLTWVEGEDLGAELPCLTETEQYAAGLKAGELLKKLHSLPAHKNSCGVSSLPKDAEPWEVRFFRKVQGRIDFYNAKLRNTEGVPSSPDAWERGDLTVQYLIEKKHLLEGRPQTFNHGDFNASNLILMPDGRLGVIDFNFYNGCCGDPWWEFDPVNWGGEVNPYYCTGLLRGYFYGGPDCTGWKQPKETINPPHKFFEIFSYYLAYDALAALCDTSENNQGEPEEGVRHMENVFNWLDGFKNPVPNWYLKNLYVQWIDGMPCRLKEPFDFSFLSKYGRVFKVFDDQDSGNICFGADDGKSKRFVKFAGAPAARISMTREEAIQMMKKAVKIYTDLAHPALANLLYSEEIGGGLACVFEWRDAYYMGKQYPQSREKFMRIPIEEKLKAFEDILLFHAHAAKKGYVAIDFYDGSIMYDYEKRCVVIYDIELYEKAPVINRMGRMYGSSRFMSPEEFSLGAELDEVTNVYAMGAAAFELFGDNRSRSFEKWTLSEKLYETAKKAVSDVRADRQQSLRQLIDEWTA